MTSDKQIDIAKRILESGIVKKVFHNVQLLRDEQAQTMYPVYPKGAEYTYAGIDDTQGLFGYIRTNGDYSGLPLKLDSCSRAYTMSVPLRVVFFSDSEDENHEHLVTRLSLFTFLSGVTLLRIITDKYRLLREESPLFRASFDAKTFYVAFDINATIILLPSTCEIEKCIIHPNPLLPCPVVAPGYTESATS